MKIKVALAQFNIQFADPDKNQQRVAELTSIAAKAGADVIVFPEMWNIGYALNQLDRLADDGGRTTTKLFYRLARQYQISIVGGSVAVKEGGHFYNRTLIVDPLGQVVGKYDKVHLFRLMNEHRYLTAGNQENYFRLAGVPNASFICYDLRFPEWIRTVARHGSAVLYFPAEWPAVRIPQWTTMLKARAIENQAFVVAVNRVGDDPDNHYNGHSLAIDPLGNVIADAGENDGITYAELDLTQLATVRGAIPVFVDRRPDLYK
ncbi:carbon-nitrogen family hydrolase [Lactobacillus helveticus]|uniref:carbon-nitrogen family hydrolase n=1 Tax=Lactobacillus helveticus TaxID=1587 RepID=UPI0021A65E5A|nr:carbon-nitrogen family hydrolase [Lactobacillus helveticus]MCT3412690.1 carbon-nitrogen family hydrolase [Lactobacillus helveticus]MCT3416062.1 carbon-nitrogen family hydrolase [Lactobacillus helveticus]MCT3426744.1 carbon-nitrogen family hydrolase [Lactobacillus helveticus]